MKIDEITNLGAVKIRLRSLFAACRRDGKVEDGYAHMRSRTAGLLFTKEMQQECTPFSFPICCRVHFELFANVFGAARL